MAMPLPVPWSAAAAPAPPTSAVLQLPRAHHDGTRNVQASANWLGGRAPVAVPLPLPCAAAAPVPPAIATLLLSVSTLPAPAPDAVAPPAPPVPHQSGQGSCASWCCVADRVRSPGFRGCVLPGVACSKSMCSTHM